MEDLSRIRGREGDRLDDGRRVHGPMMSKSSVPGAVEDPGSPASSQGGGWWTSLDPGPGPAVGLLGQWPGDGHRRHGGDDPAAAVTGARGWILARSVVATRA